MIGESEWYPAQSWVDDEWYERAEAGTLRQCDIIPRCPVPSLSGQTQFPLKQDDQIVLNFKTFDLMILSQSCDLANDKIETVLLAKVMSWEMILEEESKRGNQFVKSKNFRQALVRGNVPGMTLLKKYSGDPSMDWSLVSFHSLFTLERDFLIKFLATCGPRLRLRSPYREHLAQAFARFIMRVGLPHDAGEFEKLGEVKG